MCNIKGKGNKHRRGFGDGNSRTCYCFSSFIQKYRAFIFGDFHQNGLLQFIHINLEQNKALVSLCILCNT